MSIGRQPQQRLKWRAAASSSSHSHDVPKRQNQKTRVGRARSGKGFSPAAAARHFNFGIPIGAFSHCNGGLGILQSILIAVSRTLHCA